MSEGEKKQSYLLSKKGRPVLIGVILVSVGAVLAAIFMVGALTPEKSKSEQMMGGAEGSGDIEAERNELRPNLTSGELTKEQQRTLDTYNEQAESNTNLHPVPTISNVRAIELPKKEEPAPVGVPPKKSPLTYTPPVRKVVSTPAVQVDEGPTKAEIERQKRRQSAAIAMLRDNKAIPEVSIASVAFSSEIKGEGSSANNRNETPPKIINDNGTPRVVGIGANQTCELPAVKGGDIIYANNEIALNSDYKGAPVKVTFLSGALRNWTGMGSYQTNEFGEKMMVKVNRVIDPQGNSINSDVSGFVLDPDTTLWAVASDVDRHLIYRYGGLGLSSILKSFGVLSQARALSSQRSTDDTIVNEYREPDGKQVTWTVAGEIGGALEKAFADNINRPITITLDRNEEVGVLFENTICLDGKPAAKRIRNNARGLIDPVIRTRS